MSSVSRIVGIDMNTVVKLLVDAGNTCLEYHDETVRNVRARYVQCDEMWSYIYAKQRNVPDIRRMHDHAGTIWTWTAIDADTRFMVTWLVGDRTRESAADFMWDIQYRVAGRPQISTDGLLAYIDAVRLAFRGEVDYARQPHESEMAEDEIPERIAVEGQPNLGEVNSSYVERQNLTMRMSLKRLTRQTNAFSKKLENHCHALSLYFVWYNFIRVHSSIGTTPAVAIGLADKPYTWEWLIGLMNRKAELAATPRVFAA